ncbi:MAG: ABC transporter ATP-binding protein [Saprospiraceae bacterium]|nr:ABC transporter ATP-binding protein [Saprospiraceae bacterium]
MSILSVRNVVKKYQDFLAVDHVSFEMPKGSILGLLGPNGAGKTSLIRIITTITQADAGTILFDGEALNLNHPGQIGYLPEERGLYKKMKVGEQLIYLARLKGLKSHQAKEEIGKWLHEFEMEDWWDKKIEELSKGMQQKVQFVSTIVHGPKLIILDEPFSGLDPINTNLMKKQIRLLNESGTSVIFSTHRMEQVEEICEYIVLINGGKNILDGIVTDIKNDYKDHIFHYQFSGEFPAHLLSQIDVRERNNGSLIAHLPDTSVANQFMKQLMDSGLTITAFSEMLPTLNDIFIKKVTEENG